MHTKKKLLMGNEAIAMGALAAGVNVVCGYPGTPSTEVLETISKENNGDIYVEWSVNEKAAMELAAGAAYSGARALVTMKQVGLNVASDPLMSLEYVGVKGGMVVMVADDPGPISSQTEQDTRTFAAFSKLPCFDPSSPEEAYEMIGEAFEFSEKYKTPVFFRPTTRVCHGYASIDVKSVCEYRIHKPEGFIKDSSKWVIFPKLSFAAHKNIEKRNADLTEVLSNYSRNTIFNEDSGVRRGIATHGISYTYVMDSLMKFSFDVDLPKVFKVSTPFPFPEELAVIFLNGLDEVICVEELDPVIERALTYVCGKYHLNTKIYGKLTGNIAASGENTCDSVTDALKEFFKADATYMSTDSSCDAKSAVEVPALPIRPPVLCSGCPHRASFYAVKEAMKGKKSVFCGDIGCYTLGNAMPLDMVDTCLCMGAGINMAQAFSHVEPDITCFAFVGDSTFFASAITGVINAVYNQADMVVCILDNSTTAMTGHQPHPGTGKTMMGQVVEKVSIENVLKGIGLTSVTTVDPLNLKESIEVVKRVSEEQGVRAIIFKSPCAVIIKPWGKMKVDSSICINCKKCIKELGCPSLIVKEGKVAIDNSLCNGCKLCTNVCPVHAIVGGLDNE